ncbi:hypothetical protein E2C01_033682 [Portunus trituberculatus]|uniref:Uncharacterized protein n=1 Tax=Portunus trituberculatus TaxID=210409 RepID=A0A5B7F3K4_PORTR|nr:hypothetical protein [Portunus trituberculatus]
MHSPPGIVVSCPYCRGVQCVAQGDAAARRAPSRGQGDTPMDLVHIRENNLGLTKVGQTDLNIEWNTFPNT